MFAQPIIRERRDFLEADASVPAEVHIPTGVRRGELSNLSRFGAELRVASPPAAGSPALVKWADQEVMGQIVWSRADCCGVRFDRLLSVAAVESSAAAAVAAPRTAPSASLGKIPLGARRGAACRSTQR